MFSKFDVQVSPLNVVNYVPSEADWKEYSEFLDAQEAERKAEEVKQVFQQQRRSLMDHMDSLQQDQNHFLDLRHRR